MQTVQTRFKAASDGDLHVFACRNSYGKFMYDKKRKRPAEIPELEMVSSTQLECIGEGRFWILGGPRFRILCVCVGGGGGGGRETNFSLAVK